MYGRRLPPIGSEQVQPQVQPPQVQRFAPIDPGPQAPAPMWGNGPVSRPAGPFVGPQRDPNEAAAALRRLGQRGGDDDGGLMLGGPARRPDGDDDGGLMLGGPARRPDGDDDELMLGGPSIPKASLRLDESAAARMGTPPPLPSGVPSAPEIAVSLKPAAAALLDPGVGPSATTAPAKLPLVRMSVPPPPPRLDRPAAPAAAPAPATGPVPAKGNGFLEWMARGYANEPSGKGWDIDGWVAKQSGDARIAAERMAPLLKAGASVGQAAASLAIPAAVIAPALAAGIGANDQFGEAGGALAGGATGLGGLAGAGAGWVAGGAVPYVGGRGGRMIGALLGGLAGSGLGAGGAQLANTAAQGLVDRANAGRGGISGTVGSALDALGYQGSNDAIRQQMAAMEMNPAVQLLRQQERARKAEEQNALVQQIYLQSLARGAG